MSNSVFWFKVFNFQSVCVSDTHSTWSVSSFAGSITLQAAQEQAGSRESPFCQHASSTLGGDFSHLAEVLGGNLGKDERFLSRR